MSIPASDTIAFPPGWKPIKTDIGTATEALEGSHGQLIGYLNLTPSVRDERLSSWPEFRVDHNADEHDSAVQTLAAGRGLPFAAGRGSCVRDRYTTTSSARYIEIACLIIGPRRGVVAVAAAPPEAWGREAPELERALAGVRT